MLRTRATAATITPSAPIRPHPPPSAPSAATRTRPAARPFSAYAQEYSYVLSDLRRVTLVGGGLLLALLVLSFFVN